MKYHGIALACPDCAVGISIEQVGLRADAMLCIIGKCTKCDEGVSAEIEIESQLAKCYAADREESHD